MIMSKKEVNCKFLVITIFINTILVVCITSANSFEKETKKFEHYFKSLNETELNFEKYMNDLDEHNLPNQLPDHPFVNKSITVKQLFLQQFLSQQLRKEVSEVQKDKMIQGLLDKFVNNKHTKPSEQTRKLINSTAICYAAASIKSVTPIRYFANEFAMTVSHFKPSSQFMQKIEHYPVMYLALQCNIKSIPVLEEIIRDLTILENFRVQSFVILYKIDDNHAKSFFAVIEDELNNLTKEWIKRFLQNPDVKPWEVPGIYSARSQHAPERFKIKKPQ